MREAVPIMSRDKFVLGFGVQSEWAGLIAAAFFLGKIGAGLFVVGAFLGYPQGMITGLVIAVAGKGISHLLYLGRPERFWRAVIHQRSSWIARGILAMLFLAIFGGITAGSQLTMANVPGTEVGGFFWIMAVVAGIIIMIYDGFVMAASPAIPLWNTAFMPVLCLSYSALGGVTLTLLLLQFFPSEDVLTTLQGTWEIALVVLNMIIIGIYILAMKNSVAAAKTAISRLLKGRYAALFNIGVVAIGLVLVLILNLIYHNAGTSAGVIGIAIADLVGHFLLFYVLLRSALFNPLA